MARAISLTMLWVNVLAGFESYSPVVDNQIHTDNSSKPLRIHSDWRLRSHRSFYSAKKARWVIRPGPTRWGPSKGMASPSVPIRQQMHRRGRQTPPCCSIRGLTQDQFHQIRSGGLYSAPFISLMKLNGSWVGWWGGVYFPPGRPGR